MDLGVGVEIEFISEFGNLGFDDCEAFSLVVYALVIA